MTTPKNERTSNSNSFEIFKTKILMTIDKTKEREKSADIIVHIVQGDATNVDKNTIKDFVNRLVAQKLVIKKNTS